MSVQFEHDSLALRNCQSCVCTCSREILCQFDHATIGQCGLQGSPIRDATDFLVQVKACVLTIHSGNLAVLHSDMQRLLRHTCLCRKGHHERIGVGTVTVVHF